MKNCINPRSHICDSAFYRKGYTTDEARQIFCDRRRLQRWLDVENALAQCQARLGMIPEEAADILSKTASINELDLTAIQKDIAETGHSLIPLLNAWQNNSPIEAARFIHYGATTQDIQDTAQSLELKDIFQIIERDLAFILGALAQLAEKHKNLPIIGRTHGQPALPTTLGLKIAIWIDELFRNITRLKEAKPRVLVSQLFGGVGSMDAFGDKGMQLLELFSENLGLNAPHTAWHAARDRTSEFLCCLALISGNLAKIANEICQLARDEIGELEEPFHMGKIGSTTMPHKRNPEQCEQVVVLARLIKNCASTGFETLINEHERDYRAVRLEWAIVTDACLYTCGLLDHMKNILPKLLVHEDRIMANFEKSACLLSTETLMFLLGEQIGKQNAHKLIYEVSMHARSSDRHLVELLMEQPEIKEKFTLKQLQEAIKPAMHIGTSVQITENLVKSVESFLGGRTDKNIEKISCPLAGKGEGCSP